MAQLVRTRRGWENEHLAKYLLSKIAFIANPSTVSDDVGTDLICTLFEQRDRPNDSGEGTTPMLYPLSTFAIQIKTKPENGEHNSLTFDQDAVEYLLNLKIPFFLAVADQENARLNIFSGEYLPLMFSTHGGHDRVRSVIARFRDLEAADLPNGPLYVPKFTGERCEIVMPPVASITVTTTEEELKSQSAALKGVCDRTLENIASRVGNEFIFKYAAGTIPDTSPAMITPGPGSFQHFRTNFCYRLAEAFANLGWAYTWINHQPQNWPAGAKEECRVEFALFEACYQMLKKRYSAMPMADESYGQAKIHFDKYP